MNLKNIKSIVTVDKAVEIRFENGKMIRLEDCWLRDNCRCSSCYRADTFQRALHILEIPEATINSVHYNNSEVSITWSDDHESVFSIDFLLQFDYKLWHESRRLRPILWHGGKVANKVARIHVDKFINTVDGAKAVFQSLLDYGFALIEGVEANLKATEVVPEALGGVQNTLYGKMWQFTNIAEHADTAYTHLPLAVHHDTTYFTESAGLQILHCIEHTDGTGGDTLLVDGFYGAMCLKEEHPEDYEFLTTFDIEALFIEDGHHQTYSAPIIKVDKNTQDVKQIRFNVYDRSPMAFRNSVDCRMYYRSLRNLSRYYQNPNNQWQFKLKPGVVLVMDNFRLLHGRTAFTGNRIVCGCYVARSDWLDKARTLKLIQ